MAILRATLGRLAVGSAALAASIPEAGYHFDGKATSIASSIESRSLVRCGSLGSGCRIQWDLTRPLEEESYCESTTTVTSTVYYTPTGNQYQSPAGLPNGSDNMGPGLPQNETNGDSPLGTWNAPTYNSGLPNAAPDAPWGSNITARNTNPYTKAPNTGVTRMDTYRSC